MADEAHNEQGGSASTGITKNAVFLAAGIYVAAPAVPWLLGGSYQLSTEILRWLCFLPFFIVVQSVGSDALSGANSQRRVSLLHTLTAGVSLLLNLLLVPHYGWRGAVMAAYGSQGFLIAGLLATIMLRVATEREAIR